MKLLGKAMNLAKIIFLTFALALGIGPAAFAQSGGIGMLSASVLYSCSGAVHAPLPTVSISARRGGPKSSLSLHMKRTGNVYAFEYQTHEVHFWMSVSQGPCGTLGAVDDEPVTVLPGHVRHLYFFPSSRFLVTDAYGWIAGTIPDWVEGVSLTTLKGRHIEDAFMDDGCYYFEFVPKIKMMLRISVNPGLIMDMPIDTSGTADGEGVRVDITADEIWRFMRGS